MADATETQKDGWPGPADVEYFAQVQAGGWGQTLGAFLRFLALPPGMCVLDAGTGPGLLPRLMAGAGAKLALGCDDSPPMIRRAAELSAGGRCLAWAISDALHLPFRCGAFDAVTATNLLFLMPDPAAAIASLARATRVGGVVGFDNPGEAMSEAAAGAFADSAASKGSRASASSTTDGSPRRTIACPLRNGRRSPKPPGLRTCDRRRTPAGW